MPDQTKGLPIHDVAQVAKLLRDARPAHLKAVQNMNKQLSETLRPAHLDAIQNMTKQWQEAVRPAQLDVIQKHKELLESIRPTIVQGFLDLSVTLSTSYGPVVTRYAAGVGRSVVERTDAARELDLSEKELMEQHFVPLQLTESEMTALYWLFALTITLLGASGSALSEEASRALQTLAGFLTLFLTLAQLQKK